jgi:hypothetical protein
MSNTIGEFELGTSGRAATTTSLDRFDDLVNAISRLEATEPGREALSSTASWHTNV